MQANESTQFVKKIFSKIDKTVKYIFTIGSEVIEFSYINKNDGKDIICAPTQTSCRLGCKFCFLSDYDLKVRNLTPYEIIAPITHILDDLRLPAENDPAKVLLISFMGCGEPLLNLQNVIEAAKVLRSQYATSYTIVRFAVATLMPQEALMHEMINEVKNNGLLVKLHLSLHSPHDDVRHWLMPAAININQSIDLIKKFRHTTGNSVEIHYTMIDGVNDRDKDLAELIKIFIGRNIPIKFLIYNEKPSLDLRESSLVAFFRKRLADHGIMTEFYIPPGRDVGSSCGQFLMDYYLQYSQK